MEPTTLELTSVTNSWSSTTSSMPTMTSARVEFDSKSLGLFYSCVVKSKISSNPHRSDFKISEVQIGSSNVEQNNKHKNFVPLPVENLKKRNL